MKTLALLVLAAAAVAVLAACSSGSKAHQDGESHAPEGHEHRFEDPEKYAERWNSPERAEWQKPSEVIELMELEPGMTVVDLGAGTGYFVPYLAAGVAPDGKVLALDVEDSMVAYLEKRKFEKGWSFVEPRKTATDDPQLPKQSVDRVLTVNTWHHIAERKAYARKLASALREGGMVVVVDYEKSWDGDGPPAQMRLEAAEIEADFAAAGLKTSIAIEGLPRQFVVIARK